MSRRTFDLHRAERTATRRVERPAERIVLVLVVLAFMARRQYEIRVPRRSR